MGWIDPRLARFVLSLPKIADNAFNASQCAKRQDLHSISNLNDRRFERGYVVYSDRAIPNAFVAKVNGSFCLIIYRMP